MPQPSFGNTFRHVLRRIDTRPPGDHTDGALLAHFAARRDEAAFATLVSRHGPMVLGVCRRVLRDPHDADDAFQATFLVLARKAATLDGRRPLGCWLYTVARNLALKHRAAAVRRRTHEKEAGAMTPTSQSEIADWREVCQLLDVELGKLTETHRAPLVLCHLQGLTHEAAARELGWPVGSLAKRLARGQELLRERLAGRGVTLSSAALATLVTERGSAAVPPALAAGTARAAAQFAAGKTAAASAVAVSLAGTALPTTAVFKITAALLLGISLLGAGAGVSLLAQRADAPANAQANVDAQAEPPAEANQSEEDKADKVRDLLMRPVNLDKGIDPNTPLQDALDFFSDRYDLTIRVDHKAFADAGLFKATESPISLPRMVGIRLDTVLRLVAGQIELDNGMVGGIRIQGDTLVLEPVEPSEPLAGGVSRKVRQRLLREAAWDKDIADETPLPGALDLLAARYGEKFIFDRTAFQAFGVPQPKDLRVSAQKLAGTRVPLADLLDTLLAEFNHRDYFLDYRLKPDGIEITAAQRFSREAKALSRPLEAVRDHVQNQRKIAKLSRTLDESMTVEVAIDPNTPFNDTLVFMSDRFDATMIIDSKAFAMIGIDKVEEFPIQLPFRKWKLGTMLQASVDRVEKGDWIATFILQPDYIEIAPIHKHVKQKKPLTKEQLDGLWKDLAHHHWRMPVMAFDVLSHFPDQAVKLVTEHIQPAPPADPQKAIDARRWVKDLDSKEFAVREKATEELEKLGGPAIPALREQLKANPTLDIRQRVEKLLAKLEPPVTRDQLRELRAIRLLEEIATPEAELVLHGLVQGAPGSPRTEEAKAALLRSQR